MPVREYEKVTCDTCGTPNVPIVENLGVLGLHPTPEGGVCERSFEEVRYAG